MASVCTSCAARDGVQRLLGNNTTASYSTPTQLYRSRWPRRQDGRSDEGHPPNATELRNGMPSSGTRRIRDLLCNSRAHDKTLGKVLHGKITAQRAVHCLVPHAAHGRPPLGPNAYNCPLSSPASARGRTAMARSPSLCFTDQPTTRTRMCFRIRAMLAEATQRLCHSHLRKDSGAPRHPQSLNGRTRQTASPESKRSTDEVSSPGPKIHSS